MVNVLSLCLSVLFLSNLAFAATGAPHVISNKRGGHARVINSIQRRAADDRALEDRSDFVVAEPRKRSSGRCKSKTTTSTSVAHTTTTSHTTTTTKAIGNPGQTPSTSTHSTHTTTHTTHSTTSVKEAVKHTSTKHTTTKKAAVKTTSTKKSHPTTSVSSGGDGKGKTYSGQGTYYATGLGACGITNKDTDKIAAVSHILYDSWPGATANPNKNPICGRHATAHYKGKSVTVKITDRCVGCAKYDLDFSPSAFKELANESLGRIDITWQWD